MEDSFFPFTVKYGRQHPPELTLEIPKLSCVSVILGNSVGRWETGPDAASEILDS